MIETTPNDKSELLDRMRAGRAAWDALLSQVPADRMTDPKLANGWSVKDLIAHIAAYEKWTAGQIAAASEGRDPTIQELYGVDDLPATAEQSWDTDSVNALIFARYQDETLEKVRALAGQSYAALVAAIDAVPETEIDQPASFTNGMSILELVPGQTYGHYEQHVDDLRALINQP